MNAVPVAKPSQKGPKTISLTMNGRLLECRRCNAPVLSSAWSGIVVVKCEACRFEEERLLDLDNPSFGPVEGSEHPYRTSSGDGATSNDVRPKRLQLDLDAVPSGLEDRPIDAPTWRAALARAPRPGEDASWVEWERVWLAVCQAAKVDLEADFSKARAVLETTLESVAEPAYRALLLAHLAQHAAVRGSPRLARKWLRACPRVERAQHAEVTSELLAASALIALTRGELEQALDLTGDLDVGCGYTPLTRGLAVAINLEARERLGDYKGADAIVRALKKNNGLTEAFTAAAVRFRLGMATLERGLKRTRRRAVFSSAATTIGLTVFAAWLRHLEPRAILIPGLLATIVATLGTWVLTRPTSAPMWMQRARWIGETLGPSACGLGVYLWMMHAYPGSAPPAPASTPTSSASVGAPAPTEDERGGLFRVLDPDETDHDEAARAFAARDFPRAATSAKRCLRTNPLNEHCGQLLDRARAEIGLEPTIEP